MKRSNRLALISATVLIVACESQPPVEPATLVLQNGKVVTVDDSLPEAQAIAVNGYTIVAVGSNEDIERYIGPNTEVIDLNGRLAVPGFIEGHGHFMGLGRSKMILELADVKNFDEIVAMVRDAVAKAKPGEWIMGRGWHQEKWDKVPEPNVEGIPLHTALDSVSPDNPVLLTHASGHAAFANGAALRAAGVDRRTPNPRGGELVKDAAGNPTGFLRETAQGLVSAAANRGDRPAEDVYAERRQQVQLAGREALENGVTTFQDAGSPFEIIDFLKTLEDRNELPIRLYIMVRGVPPEELDARLDLYRMEATGNDYLTVRSIKQSIDGALGSRGAWLLEPYADMPSSAGLNTTPLDRIEQISRIAFNHGFQMNIHAIGDRANREVLNVYEKIFAEDTTRKDLRWRIEHSQHLHPDDVKRFAQLNVVASMQCNHATSDGPWVFQRLGPDRARSGAYVWRDLMNAGVIINNGTDVPVEKINAIANFYSCVTRNQLDGTPFFAEQKMTRQEALRAYTLNNAWAAFEETIKGSITVGKLADITVIDKDIMTIPASEIPTARVDLTIVGGEVKFRRE
jgi:predicted amidohydrolase YtcJ